MRHTIGKKTEPQNEFKLQSWVEYWAALKLLAPAQEAVQQPEANAQDDAYNIRDPVVYIRTAVESWLDEFNDATKGSCTHKHWEQSKAANTIEMRETAWWMNNVHHFVAFLGPRGQLVSRATV